MRKLNVKFLLFLLAALVIFGGGAVLAHSLQFKRIPLALLKQAGKAEAEGDLRRAIGYLDRYLTFLPNDGEQRGRIALLLADGPRAPTRKLTATECETENHEADQVLATLVANNPKAWEAFIARWDFRRDFCLRQPRQDIRSPFLKGVFNLLTHAAGAD